MVWETPVDIPRLPLTAGKRWTQIGRAGTGAPPGLQPSSEDNAQEVEVDPVGDLLSPAPVHARACRSRRAQLRSDAPARLARDGLVAAPA